jgi:hypothetical protein
VTNKTGQIPQESLGISTPFYLSGVCNENRV